MKFHIISRSAQNKIALMSKIYESNNRSKIKLKFILVKFHLN